MSKPKPLIKRFKPSAVWRAAGVNDPWLWGVFPRPASRKPVAASRCLPALRRCRIFRGRA